MLTVSIATRLCPEQAAPGRGGAGGGEGGEKVVGGVGAVAGAVANADSAELLSELSFLYSSQRQILEPFLLIVENSVRRPGTNYPGTVASVSYAPDTTADYMIRDPANADAHCASGFEALWRIVA